ARERQHHRREPDDRCRRHRDRGELDPEHHRGSEYADGGGVGAHRQPGDLHCHRHRGQCRKHCGPRGRPSDRDGEPHRGHAARSLVAATPGTITASIGASAATITVTANDQFGNPVSGVTVALAASGANNALAQPTGPTGANGQVTGTLSSTKAETKTVSATLNDATVVTATASVSVSAAAAASIAISAGDQQDATVGTAVPVPPAVIVRDAFA